MLSSEQREHVKRTFEPNLDLNEKNTVKDKVALAALLTNKQVREALLRAMM